MQRFVYSSAATNLDPTDNTSTVHPSFLIALLPLLLLLLLQGC
jgi:hypothetical protein